MFKKMTILASLLFICCGLILIGVGCENADKTLNSETTVFNEDASTHDPPVLSLQDGIDIPSEYEMYMTEYDESSIHDSTKERKSGNPTAASIGAWTSIAWPFKYEHPNLWRGDEGERSGGSMIYSCGGYIHSHSGADHYARDLSRLDGSSHNKPIYAGRSGWVVKAGWDGGYGNVVVIWDPANRVCIRYAHLNSVGVSWGQYVTIRQYIGRVGNTPGGFGSHLHLVVYENVDTNSRGFPIVPHLCIRNNWHACRVFFFS